MSWNAIDRLRIFGRFGRDRAEDVARKLQGPCGMRASIFLVALATATSTFVAVAQQQPDSRPSTVKEVMTSMTIPAADEIFEFASDPPATDERWARLRLAALTLAESGRLLATTKLAKDTGIWMDMARALVKEAERASQIADAKDAKALEAVSDSVYSTCKACHSRYMADAQ